MLKPEMKDRVKKTVTRVFEFIGYAIMGMATYGPYYKASQHTDETKELAQQ